jgi:hypothetical protein
MPATDGSAALPVVDVGPLAGPAPAAARAGVAGQIQAACRERSFTGTYGDYLLGKVSKVFPQLRHDVLE